MPLFGMLASNNTSLVYQVVGPVRILRVPGQNGISQACYIVEIYRSSPELLMGRDAVCDTVRRNASQQQ